MAYGWAEKFNGKKIKFTVCEPEDLLTEMVEAKEPAETPVPAKKEKREKKERPERGPR